MITLEFTNSFNVKSKKPVNHTVSIKRTPLYHYFHKEEHPESIIKNSPLMQLMISICMVKKSCSYFFSHSSGLAEIINNDVLMNALHLFDSIFLLFSDSTEQNLMGIDVQKINSLAKNTFQELLSENNFDSSLTDFIYNKCDFSPKGESPKNNMYKVFSDYETKANILRIKNNPILKYLLNNSIHQGYASIPYNNSFQEQILTDELLHDLVCFFDEVFLITSNDKKWKSQSIIVSGIDKLNSRLKIQDEPSLAAIAKF